ncbi:GNAT family N-acetyltransferase [Aneurinibacillus sp. Ricciae_BoGa-3]|uniref:GNAT family N-acetyltransferase n=1 Tax=Aneurinibacillus sp. Ricciae_BoGa-3 TaxID=3022697 RepID=UPI0023423729|nr:GNAT family N-acetyltransferase [Aneurinibacillus sp. Ricciae_BoGa-3]WCK53130.1 GNAT family N-acetyltransferase [Aneurinibacillus sp. Ricciae_BoGa-3]
MVNYSAYPVKDRAALDKALSVRRRVFIDEQHVPEDLEIDEFDKEQSLAKHFIVADEQQEVCAAARFRPYEEDTAKIERVAVLAECRGKGLGRIIMDAIENEARLMGFRYVKLNAQISAQIFYERLGYTAQGDTFMDAGIEHIAMKKKL